MPGLLARAATALAEGKLLVQGRDGLLRRPDWLNQESGSCDRMTGAAGRMGARSSRRLRSGRCLTLGAAYERAESLLGVDAGEFAGVGNLGVRVSTAIKDGSQRFDMLVDFSVPPATLGAVDFCAAMASRMVIGTTGFDAAGAAQSKARREHIPILMAPNYSVGVNLCFKLIEAGGQSAGRRGGRRSRRSAPPRQGRCAVRHRVEDGRNPRAGTRPRLGGVAVYGRQGTNGPRDRKTIGFETIRAGDIVGEHTVIFAGAGERIEITHRAASRMNFARARCAPRNGWPDAAMGCTTCRMCSDSEDKAAL